MEELLTKVQIEQILEESKKDDYKEESLINLGSKITSVMKVSKEKGLILIKGNFDTGFLHIIQRHSYSSIIPKWNNGKLDNSSRFRLGTVPIYDFLAIGEKLFDEKNFNEAKNHTPDVFDLFEKELTHKDGKKQKYRLLTYKGTPIIHSLFPTRQKFNRKKEKRLNLLRGSLTTELDMLSGNTIYRFPFINESLVQVYEAVIIHNPIEELIKNYVQVNDNSGKPILSFFAYEEKLNEDLPLHISMMSREIGDTKKLEKYILEIEKQIIDPFI